MAKLIFIIVFGIIMLIIKGSEAMKNSQGGSSSSGNGGENIDWDNILKGISKKEADDNQYYEEEEEYEMQGEWEEVYSAEPLPPQEQFTEVAQIVPTSKSQIISVKDIYDDDTSTYAASDSDYLKLIKQDPKTAIIMHEILGKPKALQD